MGADLNPYGVLSVFPVILAGFILYTFYTEA